VQLCRVAERTERIGLGLGVLIPSRRHPMTNAAAIATLAGLAGAGGRRGPGFMGRMAMGQRAMRMIALAPSRRYAHVGLV